METRSMGDSVSCEVGGAGGGVVGRWGEGVGWKAGWAAAGRTAL